MNRIYVKMGFEKYEAGYDHLSKSATCSRISGVKGRFFPRNFFKLLFLHLKKLFFSLLSLY